MPLKGVSYHTVRNLSKCNQVEEWYMRLNEQQRKQLNEILAYIPGIEYPPKKNSNNFYNYKKEEDFKSNFNLKTRE